MTEEQIKHMVGRFLRWQLPESFNPDGGISFKKTFNEHTAHPMKHEPTGTNLFDAGQAEAMVRAMVEDMPTAHTAAPESVVDTETAIPMRLQCPVCGELHVDAGRFATQLHHTHACQHCGTVWRPAVVHTVGVRFLPGFKDEPATPPPQEPSNEVALSKEQKRLARTAFSPFMLLPENPKLPSYKEWEHSWDALFPDEITALRRAKGE